MTAQEQRLGKKILVVEDEDAPEVRPLVMEGYAASSGAHYPSKKPLTWGHGDVFWRGMSSTRIDLPAP
jgi:hypothetical protein